MNAALLTETALQLCSAAVEIDPLPPERLLALDPAGAAVAFIAPQGQAWVGLGCARRIAPGQGAAALWAGVIDESDAGGAAPPPTALGALPFDASERADGLWQGLLPGGLVLPERQYVQQGGRAWWRLTLPMRDADTLPARLAQARRQLAALPAAEARPLPSWQPAPEGEGPARYAAAVTQAVGRIEAGDLSKVVLARRGGVVFDAPPEPAALLARLSDRHPACVRYAWRRGAKAWLGATPETLARVEGRTLRTEALAGTRPEALAAELLASAKDRHEHEIVVDAIRRALAPLVQGLSPTCEPVVHKLRGLAHLRTPISAQLRADVDFLRLVQALHPTPAVCGLPREAAGALLAALECEPRGLYAGPFLRLSPHGEGHAVVALRGMVVAGRHAVLPAGAGIVAGSDGDAELDETRVKQRSVLDALGGGRSSAFAGDRSSAFGSGRSGAFRGAD